MLKNGFGSENLLQMCTNNWWKEGRKQGGRLFSGLSSDRKICSGQKEKYMKFHMKLKNDSFFFKGRVASCWNRLPREVVKSPSLRYSKPGWTQTWENSSCTCFQQGNIDEPQKLFSKINNSVILKTSLLLNSLRPLR